MRRLLLVLAILSLATTIHAQAPSGDEVVLVPILVTQLPGANGSIWSSVLRVHNRSANAIDFGELSCRLSPCKVYEIPAQGSAEPLVRLPGEGAEYPGTFLVVSGPDLRALDFNLRVFDESRLDQNWGTSVPVVFWSGLKPTTLEFNGIPLDSRFRLLVRVYALRANGGLVTARYFDDESPGSDALLEQVVPFQTYYDDESYLALPAVDLSAYPSVRLLRITVAADDATLPIWGMATITNNTTQAVTVYTSPDLGAPN